MAFDRTFRISPSVPQGVYFEPRHVETGPRASHILDYIFLTSFNFLNFQTLSMIFTQRVS